MNLDYKSDSETTKLLDEVWDLVHEPEDQWVQISHDNGVVISKKKYKNFPVNCLKAYAYIEAPVDVAKEKAWDIVIRPTWDPILAQGKVIEDLPDGGQIQYILMHPVLVVSSRDFVYYTRMTQKENGAWVGASSSVSKHPAVPENKGIVRGDLIITGVCFEPHTFEDGRTGTKFTYIGVVDPKGWLPHAAVNLALAKGAECVGHLRDFLQAKHDK